MKILFATFDSREDFLARLEVAETSAVLAIDTKAEYDDREELILEIGFPGLPNRILVRAQALGPDGNGGQSFCLTDEDDDKRDFLVAVANGTATASWKRKHRRFPVRLPARFKVCGQPDDASMRGDAEVEDLGSGGVLLRAARSLPDGAKLDIALDPLDGSTEIEFAGTVVWNREGESGVQFDTLGGDDMKRLRRILRDVKLRGETAE